MKFAKAAARSLVERPFVRRLGERGFRKANALWDALSQERMTAIFGKYKDYTRIPQASFVANLRLIEQFSDLDGCIVECGVWRGGMSAGMADILGPGRTYHLFDSFEGLPEAKVIDGERALEWQASGSADNCRTEEDYADQAMSLSRAERYRLHKGWFADTLKVFAPDEPIAILRLDADWYSSTAECLNHLYPLVREGGLIVLDDYFVWDGCSRAVHDYLSENALADRIFSDNAMLSYLVKTKDVSTKPIDPYREL